MSTPVSEHLRRLPLFASLPDAALDQLAAATTVETYGVGEFVFTRMTPANCFFALTGGVIQLQVGNSQGTEKVVEIIRAGQTFGEAVMFVGRPFPVDAVVTEAAEVLRVPASAVDELLATDPSAARAMLASLSIRLHQLVQDVEMYTVQPARERVLGHLRQHADASGRVVFTPSKRAIASRLGITPETLSRTLRQLADEGLLAAAGSAVVLLG